MTRSSHQIITAGIAAIAGCPVSMIAGAWLGSTLPDLDIVLGIPHRTITHWPVLPGLLGLTSWMLPPPMVPHGELINHLFQGIAFGMLAHLAEDSLTHMGIPVFLPYGKRYSFHLTETGGKLERVILIAVVCLLFWKFFPFGNIQNTFEMIQNNFLNRFR